DAPPHAPAPAGPRTSDPHSASRSSALGVLGCLTGLLQAGLLALHRTGVAGEEPGLLEDRTVRLGVDLVQRAGDAQAQRTGLAGDAAAVDAGDHVEPALDVEQAERVVDELLVQLVREVFLQRPAVDGPLAAARHEPDPGDGLLAAAEGLAGGRQRAALTGGRGVGFAGVAGGDVLVLEVDLGSGLSHSSPSVLFWAAGAQCAYWATWVIS